MNYSVFFMNDDRIKKMALKPSLIIHFLSLSAGFDSDSRPNWACCDARFQGRFTASPHIHLQRGVTKIGHHAKNRIIKGPVGLPQESENSYAENPCCKAFWLF